MIFYISMGQSHAHVINGALIDRDCIVQIVADNYAAARDRAFELFGGKFSFIYANKPKMEYFPRGIVEL